MTHIKVAHSCPASCGIDKKGGKTGQKNVLDRLQNNS